MEQMQCHPINKDANGLKRETSLGHVCFKQKGKCRQENCYEGQIGQENIL